CYVANYPEQFLMTCAKYGICPKYQVYNDMIDGREVADWGSCLLEQKSKNGI
ncbi:hypothetical protein M405DRAFT_745033, partial [Rhizopogon salebrosus TDB-379]